MKAIRHSKPLTQVFVYRDHFTAKLRIDKQAPIAINQQWAGDVTYIKVQGQWCYLAVVMDLFSRKVVGWSLEKYKTTELTLAALRKALKTRDVEPGLIFHADRGSTSCA